MARTGKSAPGAPVAQSRPRRRGEPLRVLVVDTDEQTVHAIARTVRDAVTLHTAHTLAEARHLVELHPFDLLIIEAIMPDGAGFSLARDIARSRPAAQTIIVSRGHRFEDAVEAMRVGASDYLAKPLRNEEINERLREAIVRHGDRKLLRNRLRRLRRVCRKLNHAREEVTQQVDILCNDLVNAYQELASQMQHVAQVSEYTGLIGQELDLEALLRKTVEYLLEKVGPTNAAVFLPSSDDEFTVGAYVNYDCNNEVAEVLLQHLADVVAPKVAASQDVVNVRSEPEMTRWLGADAAYLTDSHVVAFNAAAEGESLAVIMLYRDAEEPFSDDLLEVCRTVGPMLAEFLNKIIRIHHRHLSLDE